MNAVDLARLIRDFCQTLMPGDGYWPSAADVGVHGVLGLRLIDMFGEAGLESVAAALVACGAPFDPGDPARSEAIVTRFEARDPPKFARIRTAAYLAYYEHPAVILAVQGLGQPYQAMPIHEGYYGLPIFTPAETPRHGRGHYVGTDEIERVDLSGLQHLSGASVGGERAS